MLVLILAVLVGSDGFFVRGRCVEGDMAWPGLSGEPRPCSKRHDCLIQDVKGELQVTLPPPAGAMCQCAQRGSPRTNHAPPTFQHQCSGQVPAASPVLNGVVGLHIPVVVSKKPVIHVVQYKIMCVIFSDLPTWWFLHIFCPKKICRNHHVGR